MKEGSLPESLNLGFGNNFRIADSPPRLSTKDLFDHLDMVIEVHTRDGQKRERVLQHVSCDLLTGSISEGDYIVTTYDGGIFIYYFDYPSQYSKDKAIQKISTLDGQIFFEETAPIYLAVPGFLSPQLCLCE